MKKIICLSLMCLFVVSIGCKKPKASKNRFVKGPIAKNVIIADFQQKVGSDYTVTKVTANKQYEKNGKIKAKVILKAIKAGENKQAFKLIYLQKDGKWEISTVLKREGTEWKKM